MNLAAALLYWVIVALWLVVLVTVVVYYARNPRTFGTTRLLLTVIIIDTFRNVVENVYFGVYWGGQFGLFPNEIISPLNNSTYVMGIKMLSVVAAALVLGLLLRRWLPESMRERAEIELRMKSADVQSTVLASALDSASMPIIVIDAQHASRPVVYANAAYLTRYNKTADDVIGRPVDLSATIKNNAEALLEMGSAINEARAAKVVVQLQQPGGQVTTNEIALQPIADAEGRVVLLTAICNDITATRAQGNANANDNTTGNSGRDSMVGQMAGTIAHDFNNLLTVMLGTLASAREALPPQSPEGMAVNISMAAAERSSRLARRLLSYSQNRASQPELVNVNSSIDALVELLSRAVARNVSVILDLTSQRVVCDVDVGRLEDALMNLCINASDAMPNGGVIRISTMVEPGPKPNVLIAVVDNGTGMTPDVQARAFERHFTTKLSKGTGIGLASVQDFAREAGGTVEIVSSPGQGTTIMLRLPLVHETRTATTSAAE